MPRFPDPRAFLFGLALALTIPSLALAQGGAPRPRAVFVVIDSAGQRIGQLTGSEAGGNAVFEIVVRGLAPGKHGLHLHATPACDPPGFTSAGGHFNPGSRQHGAKNPQGPHAGDLGNLTVTPDSVGRGQVTVPGWGLAPAGPNSLSAPGTALVIHAAADDEQTDPTGNSGARIACAVITLP
ncbi:MAG TPA: superoxide dismutase family protein [Gemmatimonadales bacterium]|nr:superoxide dismutase family protein [Gemmatimonadales bacterium]